MQFVDRLTGRVGLVAAFTLAGVLASPASAQLVVDQQQTTQSSGGGAIAPSWSSFGQSFRPTLNAIDWAEFILRNESSPFTPISLSLSILNGAVGDNGLEGAVIATTPAVSLTSLNYAPLQFQFASTVALVPGNTYTLRVNILTQNEGLGWRQAFGNPYPNGQMFQAPYDTGLLANEDYAFREGTGRSAHWNVASGSWPTASNWSPSGVPTAAINANIANGGTCTIASGQNGQAASVSVRAGSTLDIVGALNSGNQMRIGEGGGAASVTVRNGGSIASSGVVVSADAASSGSLRIGNGSAPGAVNGPVSSAGPGEVRFNHNSASHVFNQPLSGSLSVVHQAGTTTLSSSATNYTGNTNITGGTLRITDNFNFNSPISIAAAGSLVMDIALDVRLLQGVSGSGPITVAGNTRTARLAGNNAAYAGAFSLPNGTRGMMWSSAASGSAAATWDLSGQFALIETANVATVQLGALSGSNAATQLAAFTGSGLKTLEVGALNTSTTFAGAIKDISTFGGGGTGTVALRKVGAGTLTLSNTNTNTGGVTVNAGVLSVTGSVIAATVNNGAVLAGSGSLNGNTSIAAGGMLSPGVGGVGQIVATGPVSLNGALRIDISGAAPITGHDVLQVSGSTNSIGATGTLSFGTLSGAIPQNARLFIVNNSGAGTLSGAFAGLPNGGASGTPVAALAGLGGHAEWRIYYGADQAANALTGGNDIALAPYVDVPCNGDVNGDNQVDLGDLAVLLANFGTAGGAALEDGDLDGDGDVELSDLAVMLANFGQICN